MARRKSNHFRGMCVLAELEPEEVLDIQVPFISLEYLGEILYVNTKFKNKLVFRESRKCVICGREGTVFRLEHSWHPDGEYSLGFNLYSVEDGRHILMTKDHVQPRSKGGGNNLKNLVTMCEPCNSRKGAKWSGERKNHFRKSTSGG